MSAMTINIPDAIFRELKQAADQDQCTPEQLAMLAIAEKFAHPVPLNI